MTNFSVNFTIPWLLLLLIPALLLTLIPYFRLSKKYRRTRNRIISMVLYLCIMVMTITALAGMTFSYDISNESNEIILLVDSSFSSSDKNAEKDVFIGQVLDESAGLYKVGIVKFGYDQILASPLSNDMDKVYENYKNSPEVDDSATDIAAALRFAKAQLTNLETGKIVLIADGIETDGDALTEVKTIVAESGIKVDTVCLQSAEYNDVQIIGTTVPDYIPVGENFNIIVAVQSSFKGSATLTLTDLSETDENNINKTSETKVDLYQGVQYVSISHAFEFPDLHELQLDIKLTDNESSDHYDMNNTYYSFVYLNEFNKVLLLEGFSGEGALLETYLTNAKQYGGSTNYKVTRVSVHDHPELLPETVDELRENYDQVLLANVSNQDLASVSNYIRTANGTEIADTVKNFDVMLNEFVSIYGGGVFVVGGSEPGVTDASGNPVAHAFNRADFDDASQQGNKAFADMLPVQVVDYTPPMGVMIVIDRSGSMEATVGNTTRLEIAKAGAIAALDELSYRDYIGITTLEDGYNMNVSMMSALNLRQIRAAVDSIEIGGGTSFSGALDNAGTALANFASVEVKHMILITDGEPWDQLEGDDGYGQYITRNFRNGITLSIIHIGEYPSDIMRRAANDYGHGDPDANGYIRIADADAATNLGTLIREAIGDARVEEVTYEPYQPKIATYNSIVRGIDEKTLPKLGGFYGTREKSGSETTLTAQYVPLYTQWNYGDGKVGTFMCSLNGDNWSKELFDSPTGRTLLFNIITNLMPTKDISPQKITATMKEQNYTNEISVFTDLEENETLQVEIAPTRGGGEKQIVPVTIADRYKRATFAITEPGVYKITVKKLDANGNEYLDSDGQPVKEKVYTTYKSFAYSAEYDMFVDTEAATLLMEQVASSGNGIVVTNPLDIFVGFETVFHRVLDPRVLFIILSIVLFLLDVAVRKFKFKWPHEIVRDYKEKQRLKQK